MTLKVHSNPGGPSWGQVICDACGKEQPPAADVLAAGGLIRMGWFCSGGTHFCPEHHPDKEKAQ